MEIVILEKKEFSMLLKRSRKAINIMNFLTHISKTSNPMDMEFKAEDICRIFSSLSNEDLREARQSGEIRSYSLNNKVYHSISDIIDLIEKRENKKIDDEVNKIVHVDSDVLKKPLKRPTNNGF